jgi:hypothetical protein
MHELIKDTKAAFRKSQKERSVEDKIQQLYAMQDRYLAISRAAILSGIKRDDREYRRACRLLGRSIDI